MKPGTLPLVPAKGRRPLKRGDGVEELPARGERISCRGAAEPCDKLPPSHHRQVPTSAVGEISVPSRMELAYSPEAAQGRIHCFWIRGGRSAIGTEETSQPCRRMSAVWGRPDSTRTSSVGRF